ncbi:hypothetical protein TraAM80_01341 [Trypanosoma rangeli]|uniref:Uncharacterized protein n=1 Tax=Trypanosoma rangeli TaxID=5698 RepID=A0A3R7NS64_TRYRA|nr:uncharacterized protein TraAM80_01341 [Trypanosoma rangeli]RNF10799.1 hypothetical protein TraAM80_01341 [Trypanosoma rangeli]|eukprot:RNF10799.1 hypothetical protein TraAM80_01341 [Trypanosoma rangeli]
MWAEGWAASCSLLLLPAISLWTLRAGFGYHGATLCFLNMLVPLFAACALWLRSTRLAQKYIKYVGHHCSRGDEARGLAAGASRISPVLPAVLSLIMFLYTFWHAIAVVLFLLIETGIWKQ